ncbi:MAG: hypothetical protein FJ291_12490 [Planctomycetes bacterium]|nr:hypothetical protein [Planctomycetota bacterium]
MGDERRRILSMVAEGKVSVADAERLLDALAGRTAAEGASGSEAGQRPGPAKFLRVLVEDNAKADSPTRVNIRVPLQLLRAGLKLSSLLPQEASDKLAGALHGRGIDLDLRGAKPQDIEEMIQALSDLTVDVTDDKTKVRIFCE